MNITKAREITKKTLSESSIDEYILNIENKIKDNALKGLHMVVICTENLIPCGKQRCIIFPKILEHFKIKGFNIIDRNPIIKIEWK